MESNQKHLVHPKYRPDIDGLRAIAVLSVVGYHASKNWISGGYVGVDIFFVISGYLISTILFGSLEKNKFSYAEFYARRIKRIFPSLLLVLLVTLLFGWYVLLPLEFRQFGKHMAAGAGFLSNIALWSEAGYFDRAAETKPLLHLWSLGVEEQFYILWPVVLGLVWAKNLNFLKITFWIAIISFVINIFWVEQYPTATFFLPFSRFWELMIGGILAYTILHRPQYLPSDPAALSILSLTGLAMIIFSVGFLTEREPFPGWWALIPTTGSFLVIAGGQTAWVNRYILSSRPLVWIGLISYPLYLWHWPLLSYARIIEAARPNFIIRASAVIASILLAWATYFFLERRFKRAYSKMNIFTLAASMMFIFVLGLLIFAGVPHPRNNSTTLEPLVAATGDWKYPGDSLRPVTIDSPFVYVMDGSATSTLFFGDSHIQHFAPRIVSLLENSPGLNTAIFITSGGCPPIPNVFEDKHPSCLDYRTTARKYMDWPNVTTVVIGGAWNAYILEETEDPVTPGTTNYAFYYQRNNDLKHEFRLGDGAERALEELESFLTEIARKKKVYLLLATPYGKEYSPESFFEGSRLTKIRGTVRIGYEIVQSNEQVKLRRRMHGLAVRAGAIPIDPSAYLCSANLCKVTTENGVPIFMDKGHLRPFFVEAMTDFLDETLQ